MFSPTEVEVLGFVSFSLIQGTLDYLCEAQRPCWHSGSWAPSFRHVGNFEGSCVSCPAPGAGDADMTGQGCHPTQAQSPVLERGRVVKRAVSAGLEVAAARGPRECREGAKAEVAGR